MRKVKVIIAALVVLLVVVGVVLFAIGYFNPTSAGLFIETVPNSSVFIDGEEVGRTPFKTTRKPVEIELRLIPESFEKPLVPYETRVSLVSGVETVVTREFGETDELSAGEVVSFEKVSRDETSLSVVTIPDSAQILIDGVARGFSPIKTSSVNPGEHLLKVDLKGYIERNLNIKLEQGYKLTALIKLIPDVDGVLSEEVVIEEFQDEEEDPEQPKMVKILKTGVGFLRVRDEPSTLGKEVSRVEPGEEYVFLSIDEKSGWYEIRYLFESESESEESTRSGWISDQYAEIVGGEEPLDTNDEKN